MSARSFSPEDVFAHPAGAAPMVLLAPQRYIQGPGVLNRLGTYISLLKVKRAGLLGSERGLASQGTIILDSLTAAGIEGLSSRFNGECSVPEIESQTEIFKALEVGCLIAAGGGKLVDAGKSIAFRLDIPVVIVPTLASNDAPCSALSAIYTPSGNFVGVEKFPENPALVVVDTDVVAEADERYLVAGMGDAMATWYEARVCLNNPGARNGAGARPTLAAYSVSEACAHTLYEYGEAAASAVRSNHNNHAVERIVEANTLMSGVGFESGGLALAHALAVSYTQIDVVHNNYLHGEMVSMGTMAQLAMEGSEDARKVAEFFARVGLPIHLGQLSLSPNHSNELDTLIDSALSRPIAHHMPMPVTYESIRKSLLDAHQLGLKVSEGIGDAAYRRLQS